MVFSITSCEKNPSEKSEKTERTVAYYDGGTLENASIPITDEKENQILKEGIHDKHIAYANENDIILPTFDYKCEWNAMLKELGVNN